MHESRVRTSTERKLLPALARRRAGDHTAWSVLRWRTRKEPPFGADPHTFAGALLAAQNRPFCRFLRDCCQARPGSGRADLAVCEAVCLAAAGAELAELPCSGGLLAGFAGGRWPAGRRVARDRAIQRS